MKSWRFANDIGLARWTWRTFLRRFSQHVLQRDSILTLPTGLRISLPRDSFFGTEAFQTNCDVDWGSERVFSAALDASGVVLDIGANIGYYSLYVLPLVSGVHAFEPDPRPLATLARNLAGRSNAYIHQVAVGRRDGKGTFVFEPHAELSHLSEDTAPGREIDLVTIDSFVVNNGLRVTGIKIDVEGWDLDVIEGGRATLESQAPVILTEAQPEARLFALIGPIGYRVFAFTRDSSSRRPFRGVKYGFEEIDGENKPPTKMLFLVPKRLHEKFEALVSERVVGSQRR